MISVGRGAAAEDGRVLLLLMESEEARGRVPEGVVEAHREEGELS